MNLKEFTQLMISYLTDPPWGVHVSHTLVGTTVSQFDVRLEGGEQFTVTIDMKEPKA